jgi:DNA-binding NarL/FixJ family response regulator
MQKVFLVEDSLPVRERLARMIEAVPGAQVVGQAGDVEDAIAAILAARPDLVLLDLSLERGSGFDVLRAVHGTEPGIVFYMLSNFATEPYRRLAKRLGACGFFDKSKDFDRLREFVVRRVAA